MAEPRDDYRRNGEPRRRVSPKLVIGLVVGVLFVILILQNTSDTKVDLLFWDVSAGLWILLIGAFLLGMFFGWLLPKLRRGDRADED
jgi:uncharacterized integral membrane protein